MFKYRIISFPLLIALAAAVFIWEAGGKYLFTLLAVAGCGAMLFEAARLFDKIKIRNYPWLSAAAGALISAAYCAGKFHNDSTTWCSAVILLLMTAAGIISLLMMIGKKNKCVRKISGTVAVCLIFGLPFLLLEMIYFDTASGFSQLLYIIPVVKAMDTGGYIFGMLSARLLPGGNHKIAPSISPKKSWEGVIGGLLFSVGASLIFYHFCGGSLLWYLINGVMLGILSLFGDLTESSLKRSAEVKDSANWIPGMGGILDVFDSFLYVGYYYIAAKLLMNYF